MSINILVIQATSKCNLDCSYCYLSKESRREAKKISSETLRHIFKKTLTSFLVKNEVSILWHAGEPLAAGISFYENALKIIDEENIHTQLITHGIQTNGTLLNDTWCEFLSKNKFKVGISIDGPSFLHDNNRLTWDGKGTHAQTMKGVHLLKKHNVPFGALCVITEETLQYPDELFQFFYDNDFTNVGFNPNNAVEIKKGVVDRIL